MSERWLILADDLTGAADAAVAFARRGHATEVTWGAMPVSSSIAVHALNVASRASDAADAGTRHREALRRWYAPGQLLFKKIDSTLRGQPAAEMAAITSALRDSRRPAWGLLAPANPAMRRTVRGGRVLVDGAPLEASATWTREHTYPTSDLAAIVGAVGLHAVTVSLAELRGDTSKAQARFEAAAAADRNAGTILICDADTDDDLARIVAAAHDVAPGFFAGTAGLANALARAVGEGSQPRPMMKRSSHGTLVAVGTLADVSREAARRLAARDGLELVRVTAAGLAIGDAGDSGTAAHLGARLRRGETVVALLDAPEGHGGAPDPQHVFGFAHALAGALAEMGALIVTGGETAAALLAQCQAHGIRMIDEIEPGIALGITQGPIEVPIVTKPGAFGDDGSLCRCLDGLTTARRSP